MNLQAIRKIVLDIIADIAPDEDLSKIQDDKPLREQIGLDSMDFFDIVIELRKRYKVEVPETDYPKLISLGSTIQYLSAKMC